MTSNWSAEDLERISKSEEIQIAPDRTDGSPGRPTTIWVVRLGDNLFVRSGGGPSGTWYRHAKAIGQGRISTGTDERAVTFELNPNADGTAIDTAYRTKYRADPSLPLLLSPAARSATLRLCPL
jgi:hypothetical protein